MALHDDDRVVVIERNVTTGSLGEIVAYSQDVGKGAGCVVWDERNEGCEMDSQEEGPSSVTSTSKSAAATSVATTSVSLEDFTNTFASATVSSTSTTKVVAVTTLNPAYVSGHGSYV